MDIDVDICDEDYVVEQAKKNYKNCPTAAKAWLLTSKTMFPDNFSVQFEAYLMEKNAGNVREAAKCFSSLIAKFQDKQELWMEIENVTSALCSENSNNKNEETNFLCEMFKHISQEVQHTLLILTANHCQDTMEHCRLLLLLLQRFPTAISSYGSRLIDTLLTAEKHSNNSTNPLNVFRKLLVCDLLTLFSKEATSNIGLPSKLLAKLLFKSIEYYLCKMNFLNGQTNIEHSKSENCWEKLFVIVEFIGKQLNWDPFLYNFLNSSKEVYWQRILTYCQQKSNIEEKSLAYCMLIFFLYCLEEYTSNLKPESSPGQVQINYLLLEAFLDSSLPPPPDKNKRRGSDHDPLPFITVEKSELKSLSTSFLLTANCYEFVISTENLEKEFLKLCSAVKVRSFLNDFVIDYNIYKGNYDEVFNILHASTTCNPLVKHVRMAYIFLAKKNYSGCYEQILSVVTNLPTVTGNLSSNLLIGGNQRHLHFLPLTHNCILQYCVKLLLRCVMENMKSYSELSIGHALVLSQFDWPQEEEFIPDLMEKIKLNGSFHYSLFQNYIINVDILEEITYLWTQQGGHITLDIIPHLTQRRIGTRGADKGAKEEIKQVIKRQIARSNEKMDDLILQFITHERALIMQTLV